MPLFITIFKIMNKDFSGFILKYTTLLKLAKLTILRKTTIKFNKKKYLR